MSTWRPTLRCRTCTTPSSAARTCPASRRHGRTAEAWTDPGCGGGRLPPPQHPEQRGLEAMSAAPHQIGVNTWVWTSPLDDDALRRLAPQVKEWGFDLIELPVESVGDWDPTAAGELL